MKSAWRHASSELRIAIQMPFLLKLSEAPISCIAYLPDFGGPEGMVFGALGQEGDIAKAASAAGLYCSFLNTQLYAAFSRQEFVDTLSDWGWYGLKELTPTWYSGPSVSTESLDRVSQGFLSGVRSARVPFCVNDAAVVIAGEHRGRRCSARSVEVLSGQLGLLVEFADGASAVVPLSKLRAV